MNWLILINLVVAYLSWKWAMESFDNGHTAAGWLNIFASALNAALFANFVFKG